MAHRVLNIDCTSLMLDYLSEIDVLKYERAVPFRKEIVNSYWKRKRRIVVDKISREDVKSLLTVLKLCSNLTELRLKDYNELKELRKVPTVISKNCLNINTLVLKEVNLFNEHILELSKCSKLRSLKFRCEANDNTLKTLFLSLPSLEEVSITDFGNLKGNFIFALSKGIKELKLCFTSNLHSNKLAQAIKDFYRLETLSVNHLNGSDFKLESIPTLTSLSLTRMSFHLNTVSNCNQLKKLTIHANESIENEFIISLARNCTLLEVLHIGPISFTTTTEGLAYLGNLPKLRELGIVGHYFCTAGCRQYTQCMSSLSDCQNLESLYVGTCGLTNFAVSQIIEHCKHLTYIKIEECNISRDLVTIAVDKLNNQDNRTNILKMEIYVTRADLQKMYVTHPLLEVALLKLQVLHDCDDH